MQDWVFRLGHRDLLRFSGHFIILSVTLFFRTMIKKMTYFFILKNMIKCFPKYDIKSLIITLVLTYQLSRNDVKRACMKINMQRFILLK